MAQVAQAQNMWAVLRMPEPEVVPASSVSLSSRVSSWPLTLVRNGQSYTFQKLLEDFGAYYINRDSRYLLVVAD